MIQIWTVFGVSTISAILFILVFVAWDRYITQIRLKQNQKAWDEYSKGMSFSEKLDSYEQFCEEQKVKNGWNYYYFPKIQK